MASYRYPEIHMARTGAWLRRVCKAQGRTVRSVQRQLGLASVQSVYDWFHGRTLPSLDNMCALAQLLAMPVEALLVNAQGVPLRYWNALTPGERALFAYYEACRSRYDLAGAQPPSSRLEEENLYLCRFAPLGESA